MRDPAAVLITGATGGIGAALARAYATPGRRLWLHGRREAELAALAGECVQLGAYVHTRALDLTDVAAAMDWVGGVAGEIDLAIVNAGITTTSETWPEVDRVLQTNVRAAFATIHALVPAMRARRRGQIALMSSIAAWTGLPLTPAYSASKAALKAYGEALRGALAPDGIEVNVVMPGFVRTPMTASLPCPKPFMLEPRAAAERIVRGLEGNRARISFPLPLALGMWALSALPAGLALRVVRAFGYGR